MRSAKIERKTKETSILIELDLDGSGKSDISTSLNFMDHMLENFAKHSRFDLKVAASGDIHVDDHHLVEDLGIVLGQALEKALGEKKGIARMGSACLPMDDALAHVALDLSGRPYAKVDMSFSDFKDAKLGDISKEAVPHFFESFAVNGKFNLHVSVDGVNDHHKVEACFKSLAKALFEATRVVHDDLPSTKGVI